MALKALYFQRVELKTQSVVKLMSTLHSAHHPCHVLLQGAIHFDGLPRVVDRSAQLVLELGVGERGRGAAHDLRPRREEPLGMEVEDRGQELDLRQVARRADDDERQALMPNLQHSQSV